MRSTDNTELDIVLYVEDNLANLELMRAILARLDRVDMRHAHTAEAALADMENCLPSLILMDINLPGMSGIEAFARIREQPKLAHIPVIAISANAMPHDIERAKGAGFESYLTKPFDVRNVIEEVERNLGR